MALENLNDKEIRSGFKVKVQKAQFAQHQDDYKRRQTKRQNLAKKIQAKMLQKKQLSWDENIDEEGEGLKIVILKHVIDVARANSDEYLETIKEQITEQLTQFG